MLEILEEPCVFWESKGNIRWRETLNIRDDGCVYGEYVAQIVLYMIAHVPTLCV